MKRVFSFLLFITAISCFAGTPSYMDWAEIEDTYIPISGLTFKWASGGSFSTKFEIPKDATASDIYSDLIALIQNKENPIPDNARNAFAMAAGALAQAIHSSKKATVNTKMIKQLAASIETLVGLTAADKVDSYGRVISKGNIDSMRAKVLEKKNSIASGGSSSSGGGSASDPIQINVTEFNYDTREFEQRTDDGKSKMALKGYVNLANSTTAKASEQDTGFWHWRGWIPMTSGKYGDIFWRCWGGIDTASIESNGSSAGDWEGTIGIKNFRSGSSGGCENKLSELLTDNRPNEQTARSTHKILTRFQQGSEEPELHWMSFGDSVSGSADIGADEISIETVVQEDNTTNICIYGVNEANEDAAASTTDIGYIPYVDGGDTLAWAGFSEFFNSNVFKTDENGKIILNGIDDAGASDIMIVTAKGSDEGQTVDVVKLDGEEFEKTSGGELKLDGYDSPSATCELSLDEMLTSDTYLENTRKHYFLSKYEGTGGEDATGIHWVSIDKTLEKNILPDDASITTNETNGAFEGGKLSIYGIATANDSAASDEVPYIPYVDGAEDSLAWAGITDFFSEKVFNKTSDGKIILNGVSEEGSDKVRILSVSGSGDEQEVGTIAFDNASIDGNIGTAQTIQLHAFNTAPSPYTGTQNFADALTNTAVTIQGMSVPVRVPDQSITGGYSVKYVPMGKVTGVPAAAVDQKTITIDDEDADNPKLQIIDAKTTEKGYVLKMGDDHTAGWQKLASDDSTGLIYPQGVGSGSERHEPIEITDHNDGTYGIGLRNWDTETQDFIYGAKDANPTQIKFDETIEVNDEEEIEIAGYSDADVGSMAYKSSNGLGWLTLPSSGSALLSLTKNSTPEAIKIGESLQKETVGGDKVFNVKNFTSGGNCNVTLSKMLSDPNEGSNRTDHQLMARYSSGGSTPSVHWVSIGSVIGGCGAPVDGVSITTNTTEGAVAQGDASMRGYSQQSQGAIPFKGASNLQWIAPPSSGNAVVTMSANSATKSTLGDSLEINSSTLNVTGYSGANNGYVPSKNGNGISWIIPVTGVKTDNGAPLTTVDENNTRKIAMTAAAGASSASPKALLSDGATIYWGSQSGGGNVKVDNVTISTNETGHAGQLAIKGAFSAANNSVLMKTANGIEWVTCKNIDVIVRSEYDTTTHQFKNYKKSLMVIVNTPSDPEEAEVSPAVFTATGHNQSQQ